MPPKKTTAVKKKAVVSKKIATANNIRDDLETLRTFKRRTVVWPAVLYVNDFEFKCMLYDISLGGVRLKLDLPLAVGTPVEIKIKNFDITPAIVSWHVTSFVGLRFSKNQEHIKTLLGDYAQKLV